MIQDDDFYPDDDELGEYDDEWYDDWYDDDESEEPLEGSKPVDDNGLLPCPFCGSKVKYYTRDAETGYYLMAPYTEHVIHCPNMDCPVQWEVARRTYEEAKEDWNTRYKEPDNEQKD